MFGFVTADTKELTKDENRRYCAVYCGICRRIRARAGQTARLSLSYDMTFLALLLLSLYEPEEAGGNNACALHPIRKRPWADADCIAYAADMNLRFEIAKTLVVNLFTQKWDNADQVIVFEAK